MRDREVDQRDPDPVKTTQAPNLVRSAIAPEISATVMIANVAWKATNAMLVSGAVASVVIMLPSPNPSNGLPMKPPMSVPNAIGNPYRTQITPTTPIALKLIIIMFRTVLPRTMPP